MEERWQACCSPACETGLRESGARRRTGWMDCAGWLGSELETAWAAGNTKGVFQFFEITQTCCLRKCVHTHTHNIYICLEKIKHSTEAVHRDAD